MFMYDFKTCIDGLSDLHKQQEERIKSQANEIERLKSEHYKDELVKELSEQLSKAQEDYYRGFPLSKEEKDRALQWMNAHEQAKHWDKFRNCPQGAGSIGGRYSYIFTPTSVEVLGTIKCNACGEELFFTNV